MPVTPNVLTWARERAGYTVDELATKSGFTNVEACEKGDSGPTYRQLEEIARILQLPVAAFFLPEPPDWPSIEETFRTLGVEQIAEIPPNIRLLLHKARAFQVGLEELNDGQNPARRHIVRDLHLSIDDDPVAAAGRIREYLGVSLKDQFGWPNDAEALKSWRKAFYRVGVAVFKDSFREDGFCGFCLYDEEFPLIYVNNSNAKTRQIFTLLHELAHLLFRRSWIEKENGFSSRLSPSRQREETLCNGLAAEILVPNDLLQTQIRLNGNLKTQAERLAKQFSVSREVIYRRFLDAGHIRQSDYRDAVDEWNNEQSRRGGGGNPVRNWIAYLGDEYIELVLRRYYEGRFDETELADYLAIKPKYIDDLEDTFYGAH